MRRAEAVGTAVANGLLRKMKVDSSLKTLQKTHESLKMAVDKVLPGRSLYTFGSSTVYGFMETGSDVDFVVLEPKFIVDGKGLDDSSQQARALQAHAIGSLAKTLRASHRLLKLDEVKRARVPVLRCSAAHPPAFPVPFDVTVNRRNGVRNSWLLRGYFNQYPQARWLAMAVKQWSKSTAINGPQGFLTSYAFNIMVVHYYRVTGRMKFVPLATADVAASPQVPSGLPLVQPNMEELGNDVIGFCEYYLHDFKYDTDVITLSRSTPTTTASIGWTREAEDGLQVRSSDGDGGGGRVYFRFCIEDPFEIDLNVGRNVSPFKLDILRHYLARARDSGMGWVEENPLSTETPSTESSPPTTAQDC